MKKIVLSLVLPVTVMISNSFSQSPRHPTTPRELERVVQANNQPGITVFHQLCKEAPAGNVAYSPISLSNLLGLLYAGANGETYHELTRWTGWEGSPDRFHRAFGALLDALSIATGKSSRPNRREEANRAETKPQAALAAVFSKESDGGVPPRELEIYNALWKQAGRGFYREFLEDTGHYRAFLKELDFEKHPDVSRGKINKWISIRTRGRIDELLTPGTISHDTKLVLTNVVHFHGAWMRPFEEVRHETFFVDRQGNNVQVPFMIGKRHFAHYVAREAEIVAIPYRGGKLMALIVVPRRDALFQTFTANDVTQWRNKCSMGEVELHLPKTHLRSRHSLKAPLQKMELTLFDRNQCDLSRMTPDPVYLQEIVQQVDIEVNEKGTRADAATAAIATAIANREPTRIRVNRPYLFFIIDEPTGAILFLQRINHPRKQ